MGDGIDYPKFNGFRIRISHENCTFWRYDPNLNRPSGYSTRQPNLSNTKVVQQQTEWDFELCFGIRIDIPIYNVIGYRQTDVLNNHDF